MNTLIGAPQIQIVKPYKTYTTLYVKGRVKRGKRRVRVQRCRRHTGWKDLIEDGQVIHTGNVIYANVKTAHEIRNELNERDPYFAPNDTLFLMDT